MSKRFSRDDDEEEHDGDVLDTPDGRKDGRWGDVSEVVAPGRPKRTRSAGAKGGVNLTLRDQEKVSNASLVMSRAYKDQKLYWCYTGGI